MKRCSKCREIKPESEFYKDKRSKDGLKCQCKRCHCETNISTRNKETARKNNREYMRRRRIKHPDIVRFSDKEREKSRPNDEKKKARMLLNVAVRDGRIDKPACCEECGAVGPVYGHHPDYSKPYDVEWLCSLCHGKRHRRPA